jgi:sugar phosphate isomerase/epimerase
MAMTTADGPLALGHYSINHAPFAQRCAVTAGAGFCGLSVWYEELQQLAAEHGEGWIADTLASHGLAADHLELVRLPGSASATERDERNRAFVGLAARLGVRAIHAVALEVNAPLAVVAETYGELADRAADQGLLCGIEFVPHLSATPDLASVLEVVARADRPNAKLVVDSFHFFRSGAPWAMLESLPPDLIATVQINDGPIPPTKEFAWEVMHDRLAPGAGDFDLARFVRAVDAARLPAPLAVEVMSDAMDALDPQESASAMAAATRKVLAGATA